MSATQYTTGDLAKILGYDQHVIIRLANAGQLPCWKVPGSRFRRFDRLALIERWASDPAMRWALERLQANS